MIGSCASVHPAFSRAGLKSASRLSLLARNPSVTSHRLPLALSLLACVMLGGALAQTQPAQPPAPQIPAADPAAAPADADEPIGNVVTLTGVATVIRNKDSIALKLRDDIF